MDQSDIFRLLLIVLLLANEELENNKNDTDPSTNDDFSYRRINDLLILVMAFSLFDNGQTTKNNTTF